MTRGIMEAAAEVGAKLVYADNLYMYGPTPDPLSERTPPVAQTLKGRVRAAMADELLRAHGEGRLRVVVARSSDYYGPGGLRSVLGERFFGAILAGGKVRWLGSLDQPHTVSYLGDVARALVLLGEHEGADGQVWHTPAPPPLTGRKFIALAARAAGSQAVPSLLSLRAVRVLGVAVPVLRELPELWYQWARPFESDSRKFQHAFGPFSVTSHEDALRATVEWYRGYFAGSDGLDEVAHLVRSNQT
jgi:nucleoside-diphosphate-sugar epimerase